MKYQVLIINNETKEERLTKYNSLEWNIGSEFWWTEGNMSCDCNRMIQFKIAGNEDVTEEDKMGDCSEGKFSVPYAILENGEKIELDSKYLKDVRIFIGDKELLEPIDVNKRIKLGIKEM
jgi:hypothetical protein